MPSLHSPLARELELVAVRGSSTGDYIHFSVSLEVGRTAAATISSRRPGSMEARRSGLGVSRTPTVRVRYTWQSEIRRHLSPAVGRVPSNTVSILPTSGPMLHCGVHLYARFSRHLMMYFHFDFKGRPHDSLSWIQIQRPVFAKLPDLYYQLQNRRTCCISANRYCEPV